MSFRRRSATPKTKRYLSPVWILSRLGDGKYRLVRDSMPCRYGGHSGARNAPAIKPLVLFRRVNGLSLASYGRKGGLPLKLIR
jgi:hypothetical protein